MRQVFERPTTSTRGLVDPAAARHAFALERFPPPPDLADLVERFWVVRWDLPPGESFTQVLIPHPTANVVAERDGFAVHGVPPGLFERTLAGRGAVVGVKLRPGAFRVLHDDPAATTPGAHVPAATVLGDRATAVGHDAVLLAERGAAREATDLLHPLLRVTAERARTPGRMRDLALVTEVFAAVVAGDLGPRATVADLAALAGTSVRTLQRVVARYVGVSPKWVLQRHRVHLAADLLAADPGADLAGVATRVGYYDQAHFGRDFAHATGTTPGAYALRCADSQRRLLAVLGPRAGA